MTTNRTTWRSHALQRSGPEELRNKRAVLGERKRRRRATSALVGLVHPLLSPSVPGSCQSALSILMLEQTRRICASVASRHVCGGIGLVV
jgi:hypothetical protein